jgi:hypothetical protein
VHPSSEPSRSRTRVIGRADIGTDVPSLPTSHPPFPAVLRAWGLKDTQTFGTQDPYCVVRVNDQRARTRVSVDGGTSPAFHERLTMDVFGHPPHVFVEVRSIHWSPYDRVGVVNADP